jgi:phosphoenolpyruvate carboxykinase (GTP)
MKPRAKRLAEERVVEWVRSVARHTKPRAIHWCDGTEGEASRLEAEMMYRRSLIPLDAYRFPHCFLYRSDPSDVACSEHLTFVCSDAREDAGPTNNWMSPSDATRMVWPLLDGSMIGRTMYVVPYLLGPLRSPHSRVGLLVTDSLYAVLNLRLMTRMGRGALEYLLSSPGFVRGIHSLGDLSPDRRYLCHFPATQTIWSIGSGYGGNALLSKTSHALRLASVQALHEGWLAEHMLIIGVTNPRGVTQYLAAALPSACGKTNLALLAPSLPGWTIETIGNDVCWMHPGADGRLWAINPDAGLFGIAPGTSANTNPNAMSALTHDVLFTNVALRADQTPWWEGMGEPPGEGLQDWRGRPWKKGSAEPAAHPDASFTVPLTNCPTVGHGMRDARGVPISAILFGGRRGTVTPLVYEAFDWPHGVYIGATMASETTAAATGAVDVLRNDPMAMQPFCGYNMADYWAHWLTIGQRLTRPPRIFHVNWFRTGADRRFLWPGFGENIRVLKWITERVNGDVGARHAPIGYMPYEDDLDIGGSDISITDLEELLDVDPLIWLEEARRSDTFLAKFGDRLPLTLHTQQRELVQRLVAASRRGTLERVRTV